MLGHQLIVNSTPGKGSRFAVVVPLGRAQHGRRAGRRETKPAPDGPQGARVWVIENETSIQHAMQVLLEGWGCEVRTAATAETLLDGMGDAVPDLVIADYHLDAGATGSDAIARIRDRLDQTLPALVITADRTPAILQVLQCLEIPVLGKPVPPAKLRALISHLIASAATDGPIRD
jgi:DNA-binding NtrC family response regulator